MSNLKVLGGEVLQEVAIAKTLLLRAALLLREVAVAHRFEIATCALIFVIRQAIVSSVKSSLSEQSHTFVPPSRAWIQSFS